MRRYRRIRFAINSELEKARKSADRAYNPFYGARQEILKSMETLERELRKNPNKKAEQAYKILQKVERETRRSPDDISAAEKLLYDASRD